MPPGPSSELELWKPQQQKQQMQQQEQPPVCLMWDYENVRIPSDMPSPFTACSLIRKVASTYGPIRQFRAYMETELERGASKTTTRSALQSSGVTIADTPHNGGKEVADKQLLVDLFTFALDHPQATFVLITGDKDFAYACSTLRNRRYHTVVICPEINVSESLRQSCDEIVYWRTGVLGLPMRSVGVAAGARTDQQLAKRPKTTHHQQPYYQQYNPHPQYPQHYGNASTVPYTYAPQPLPPVLPPLTQASTSASASHSLPTKPSTSTPKPPASPKTEAARAQAKAARKKERKAIKKQEDKASREKKKEEAVKVRAERAGKRGIEVIELGSSSDEDDGEEEEEGEDGWAMGRKKRVSREVPRHGSKKAALPPLPTPKRAPMAGDPLPPTLLPATSSSTAKVPGGKVARLAQQLQHPLPSSPGNAAPSSDLVVLPASARKPTARPTTRRSSLRSSTTLASASGSGLRGKGEAEEEEVVVQAPSSSAKGKPKSRYEKMLVDAAAGVEGESSDDEDEVTEMLVSRVARR